MLLIVELCLKKKREKTLPRNCVLSNAFEWREKREKVSSGVDPRNAVITAAYPPLKL